jgi:RNA binding exosome subunit
VILKDYKKCNKMSEILILKEFKKNLISFVDELIDQFPSEGDLVILRIYFSDQCEIKQVMESFTQYLNRDDNIIKKNIEERNDSFFLNHNTLFENVVDKSKILHFKKIWRSPQLDQEDKEIIWKWIDSFVFLSDKYTKNKTN